MFTDDHVNSLRKRKENLFRASDKIMSFRRMPRNRGFYLILFQPPEKKIFQRAVLFFRSVKHELEEFSGIDEILLVRNLNSVFQLDRRRNKLFLDAQWLRYPLIAQYLLPYHVQTMHTFEPYGREIEEILSLMVDFERISTLAHSNMLAAVKLLGQLKQFEKPIDGNKFFYRIASKIIRHVQNTGKKLNRYNLYQCAVKYITSKNRHRCQSALKDAEYFEKLFERMVIQNKKKKNIRIRGENRYVLWDESSVFEPNEIHCYLDVNRIKLEMYDDFRFQYTVPDSPEFYDIDFVTPHAYFIPFHKGKSGKIIINTDHEYHRNADGTSSRDRILSTIINMRTHILLYEYPELVEELLEKMDKYEGLKTSILDCFLTLQIKNRKDDDGETITREELLEDYLFRNPEFSLNGDLDWKKAVIETICKINGYLALPDLMKRYRDLKTECQSFGLYVPRSLEKRLYHLRKTCSDPNNAMFFNYLNFVKNQIIRQDKNFLSRKNLLSAVFHIPQQTVLHVLNLNEQTDKRYLKYNSDGTIVEETRSSRQEGIPKKENKKKKSARIFYFPKNYTPNN